MKKYRATIQADRYPMTYDVEGSSWAVAAARAMRLWQARFKGSRTTAVTIKMVRFDD